MKQWRMALFGREEPKIDEYIINHQTDLYSNFQGRLPNPKQTSFDRPVPAKSLVKIIREEGDFSLVTVIQSKDPKVKGTGWIQSAALEDSPKHKGTKGGKNAKVPDTRKTTVPQVFFKRGENSPTPKVAAGPFNVGTRVRIQEKRGEWTLVVMLDRVKGQGGLEGWMPTEFLSPKEN